MTISRPLARAMLLLLGLVVILPGCVVEPREGFYDHDHNRWYHNHAWVPCHEQDEHCH
jgi:hypothetical protein